MLFSGESTFANFLADAVAIFVLILWFWLFITTASDLFRRYDISGFGKVMWVILLIALPYIGIFAYILTSWIRMPYSPWLNRIQRFLYDVCDPYLRLFRRFIPPLGPLDPVATPEAH